MSNGIDKWMQRLMKAEKTSLIQDGKRKVHYTFDDKTEMAEDYNIQTGELLVRKWRKKSALGATLPWEYEVGQQQAADSSGADLRGIDLQESSSNPVMVRLDTLNTFQWRIRNMIWPAANYTVELDETQSLIVIKTANKKYYKKFSIPDLERVGMRRLDNKNLTHAHSNNTLIINYQKPAEFINMEKTIRSELSKTKASKDGDVECKPS